MACYSQENNGTVQILRAENSDGVTEYVIEIRVSSIHWTVKHRYNDFFELHQTLISLYKLDKKLLPPKKALGNTSDSFIQKRRSALEKYLQTLLARFQLLPHCIAVFLDFQKYEVSCVTQILADLLFKKGDILLAKNSVCSMDPLQLHSIQYRLVNPETVVSGGVTQDMGHVLDFVTRLHSLRIIGTNTPVGNSNLNINKLKFSINMFRNLKILEICNCDVTMLEGIDTIRVGLEKLKVKSSLKHIQDLLCSGEVYWEENSQTQTGSMWNKLTWVDFSGNQLTSLHHSMSQLVNVDYLDLHDNYITDMAHLDTLCHLRHIDLSNNRIKTLADLHTKLGNIKTLNLSGNQLESLKGFSKLYSLEYLDVRNNQISQLSELIYLGNLPIITDLMFSGNPVLHIPDYRILILKLFNDRAKEICLDDQKATEKELDTVAVLLALDRAKQLDPDLRQPTPPVSGAQSAQSTLPAESAQTTPTVGTHSEVSINNNSSEPGAAAVGAREEAESVPSNQDQLLNLLNETVQQPTDSLSSSPSSRSFLSVESTNEEGGALTSSQPIRSYDENTRQTTDITANDCRGGIGDLSERESEPFIDNSSVEQTRNRSSTSSPTDYATPHDSETESEQTASDIDQAERSDFNLLPNNEPRQNQPEPQRSETEARRNETEPQRSQTESQRSEAETNQSETETNLSETETNQSENVVGDGMNDSFKTPHYILVRLKSAQDGSPNLLLAETREEFKAQFFNQLESSYKEEKIIHITWALDNLTKPTRIIITDQATYLASENNTLIRIKHSRLHLCRVEDNLQCIEIQPIDEDGILLYILRPGFTQDLVTELSKCLERFDAEESEGCSIYDRQLKSRIVTAFHYELQSDLHNVADITRSECYCIFLTNSCKLCRLYISPEHGVTITGADIESVQIENLSVLEIDRNALTILMQNDDVSHKLLFTDIEILDLAVNAAVSKTPDCYLSERSK